MKWIAIAALAAFATLGGWAWVQSHAGAGSDMASTETLALGREVYAAQCASCHGAELEGQPNWQNPLPSGLLPAPPHDATGHTWHHPDAVLFRIVKKGTAAVVGGNYTSDMPGFGAVLRDVEIEAVLAYIKSTWPDRERSYQQEATRGAEEAAR